MLEQRAAVSLVMTVRNEGAGIAALLASIAAQTLQPDEIVIVDGGSTDDTCLQINNHKGSLPLRLIEAPGANISRGRNIALRNATNSVVAITDAGVRLDIRWLELLTEPLTASGSRVDVASGFFVADPQSPFEAALGATVLPAVRDIKPHSFLPSSRSIGIRREAWERVGGYPEWLDYCEDLVFDMRLLEAGYRFTFVPEAIAYFRPRTSLRHFYTQYYRYARGDGKADLWRKRHAIRYATYTVGPALAVWAWRHRKSITGKLALALIPAAGGAYCRRPYARLMPALAKMAPQAKAYALLMVPVVRVTGDIAKMAGYPVGVLWRIRNRASERVRGD